MRKGDPAKLFPTNPLATRNLTLSGRIGVGMHSCPGAHLAKMEMSMALLGLLKACEDIQQAAPPEWKQGQEDRLVSRLDISIRKMNSLHE